ncbi:hypothetical protein [Streptomyces sp. B1I3]|uniref:hypothetical protein n=1 Tax=Streptomyces sp. B1I3 TaxID=3042264 RepID=UPI00278A1142|nr:hypothetical protein [Streptomyces sp. B1I3]MDQ0792004.1 hypothetical protein [Streptomyces sp. B1I3]
MQLPEPYQQHAPVGQPQPGYTRPANVELYAERPPIAYVPDPYNPGTSIAIDARLIQPATAPQPRDLTPQPLIDPRAQLVFAGGAAAGMTGAGVGWGIGQAAAGIAAIGSSSAVIAIALLLLAAKLPNAARRGNTTNIHNETHNHTSWWSHSSTDN